MKVGELVEYTNKDSPLGRYRSTGIVIAQQERAFGTVVYWGAQKDCTHEEQKSLKVINESR